MAFYIFAIQYKQDDFSTNCTSGCSIPTRPVLSSSITKAGKDDQVDQEQAAHGEHEKWQYWPGTIVGSGEHDNSCEFRGRKRASPGTSKKARHDDRTCSNQGNLRWLWEFHFLERNGWKMWLQWTWTFWTTKTKTLEHAIDRGILNNKSNLASLHCFFCWDLLCSRQPCYVSHLASKIFW